MNCFTSLPGVYTETHSLTAGQCGAEGTMPVTLLVARAIEAATAHANNLGIGYQHLKEFGLAWVLSRMSVEVVRYPGINETYTVSTWLESWSRRLSERNFIVCDAAGLPLAYIRSVWATVNLHTRTIGDLGLLDAGQRLPFPPVECPIEKTPRIAPAADSKVMVTPYDFRYTDIDFNRHVNSVKYLHAILNRWPLEHYDTYLIRRMDICYLHECRYGQHAEIKLWSDPQSPLENICEIFREDARAVAVKITWSPR